MLRISEVSDLCFASIIPEMIVDMLTADVYVICFMRRKCGVLYLCERCCPATKVRGQVKKDKVRSNDVVIRDLNPRGSESLYDKPSM